MADTTNDESYSRRDEVVEMAFRMATRAIAEHCKRNFVERAIVTATVASRLSERAVFWLNHEIARQEFEKEEPAP
jgi:hypothetical protein